jgi:hypothetical protein
MKWATKEVASVHPGLPVLADQGQTGGWARRFQPERPVRTMPVVVLDIDPQDLFKMAAPNDLVWPHAPTPAARDGGRSEAADGQSADASDSLQLSLLFV